MNIIEKLEELRDYITELYDDDLIQYSGYCNLINIVDEITKDVENEQQKESERMKKRPKKAVEISCDDFYSVCLRNSIVHNG